MFRLPGFLSVLALAVDGSGARAEMVGRTFFPTIGTPHES